MNYAEQVLNEVRRAIIGKDDMILKTFLTMLAGGHLLLEDKPGVGKTTLALAFSRALQLDYKRMQFTPDVMPTDVTGFTIYNKRTGAMEYQKGAILCNLFLADELNRTSSKTQSALLEAMEEQQITIDGNTYELPRPFCVLATQNPVESESTFRLPAAQTDRFLICTSLGYPGKEDEIKMLEASGDGVRPSDLQTLTNSEEICALAESIQKEVKVSGDAASYIVALTSATRNNKDLRLGASPRATKALYVISKSLAAVKGRDYVTPDDIKELAVPVLCHRLILSSRASIEGKTTGSVVTEILNSVPVPPYSGELFDEKR